jgi:hypothetical protein
MGLKAGVIACQVTFHILVHLFKYDFWNVVVLHRVVVNDKWSGSDDLVSLWLLTRAGGGRKCSSILMSP